MTYLLTYQSEIHDRPIVRRFDTEEERGEAVRELNEWFFVEKETKGIAWKIEPKLTVEQ